MLVLELGHDLRDLQVVHGITMLGPLHLICSDELVDGLWELLACCIDEEEVGVAKLGGKPLKLVSVNHMGILLNSLVLLQDAD